MVSTTHPRIVARFIPEVYIRDYAVAVDGAQEFDCTEQILALPAAEIRAIEDRRISSDNLVPAALLAAHGEHPFDVEVRESIDQFFRLHGYEEITEQAVERLRHAYGIASA